MHGRAVSLGLMKRNCLAPPSWTASLELRSRAIRHDILHTSARNSATPFAIRRLLREWGQVTTTSTTRKLYVKSPGVKVVAARGGRQLP